MMALHPSYLHSGRRIFCTCHDPFSEHPAITNLDVSVDKSRQWLRKQLATSRSLHFFALAKTLYLFTADDIVSIIIPKTVCGIIVPFAGTLLRQPRSAAEVVLRSPLVFLWIWIHLLLFNVSNQRQAKSIMEDKVNKPQRPLPLGRLTVQGANKLSVGLFPLATAISLAIGGIYPSLVFQALTFWYNDLEGGEHWLSRNLLNAGGYLGFITGAIEVAVGSQTVLFDESVFRWFGLLAMVVSTTMHAQDLYDQEGDRLRGRKTIPLVFGDVLARYSIMVSMTAWSFITPLFWRLKAVGFMPPVLLSAFVGRRMLDVSKRSVKEDKRTFLWWNIWIISLYLLPVSAHYFGA
ncbi:MAG: hypothetical protein LQ342_008361 [Letrouitia transgressa]|nr:MAG: hypothetical protein LQ342_008361 [Letrouitia transgressa]